MSTMAGIKTAETLLNLDHICKGYGSGPKQLMAVKDICLSLKAGEFLYAMSPEPCIPIQPLQFILNIKKEARINYGLVNGFSSGGTFISIVLKRIDI